MTPEYRKRLGPRFNIGPFSIGHKLGEVVGSGEAVYFDEGFDTYGGWGSRAKVTEDGTVKISRAGDNGGIWSQDLGEARGKAVHRTSAGKVLRCVSE